MKQGSRSAIICPTQIVLPHLREIVINNKRDELRSSFWSHFVTFSMPFPTMGQLYMFKKNQKFQNLGHMTDDVITGNMADPQLFFLLENVPR